jgi:hypothetical protein
MVPGLAQRAALRAIIERSAGTDSEGRRGQAQPLPQEWGWAANDTVGWRTCT